MAKSKDRRTNRLRALRRQRLRRAKRAHERRYSYLKAKKWARARRALRVYRKNRRAANAFLRKIRHRRKVLALRKSAGRTHGVMWYDGRQCAAWLVPYLDWARSHGWRGRLNSGWRDPAYSEKLCYGMCGRPACPGRCAGRASNHSGSTKPRGAIDVSDYGTFGALMRRCPLSPRIFNGLGSRDPVHFSASGN